STEVDASRTAMRPSLLFEEGVGAGLLAPQGGDQSNNRATSFDVKALRGRYHGRFSKELARSGTHTRPAGGLGEGMTVSTYNKDPRDFRTSEARDHSGGKYPEAMRYLLALFAWTS